jgi:cyclophilin family peptidyl-prolyl cis-trans isomerase/HEAT repeat protein
MTRWAVLTVALLTILSASTQASADVDPVSVEARIEYILRRSDAGTMPTPMLVAMLRDPFPETRVHALRVVAAAADPSQALLLREFMRDRDFLVRYQAMVAAGRLGPAGRQVALTGLRDDVDRVRQAAAWAASHGGEEALEPILARLAIDPDIGVRATAMANLWRFTDGDWLTIAGAASTDEDDVQLRRAAAYALARDGRAEAHAFLRRFATDPEPVIRATAVAGFGRGALSGDDLTVVEHALGDDDVRVRIAAFMVLAVEAEPRLDQKAAATAAAGWRSNHPHEALAALRAAARHPEIGRSEELMELAVGDEPWQVAEAFIALARRGGDGASKLAQRWLASGELWQRRAVAAAAAALGDAIERAVVADAEPAVKLAWIEHLEPEQVATRTDALRSVVAGDPDPPVRAAALELLANAGAAGTIAELLGLERSWRDDEVPDARAAALAAALGLAESDGQRREVLEQAADAHDPALAVMVTNAARDLGLEVRSPEREPRHNQAWYADLVDWMIEPHSLDVITDRGTFRIRLDALETPISSREIVDLAADGFYDGLTFHRVVPNFVVQWGDPRGDGWGGPGFTLPDEPAFRPFDAWRVGVATSGPNTGGSQLFVTLMPADHLTGHYTNLGEVVAGREVLMRLRPGDRIRRVEVINGEPTPLTPTLIGELEWSDLATVPGWQAEHDGYVPDAVALERLATATGSYRVVTVLGTWCSDSEREVPRLVKVLDEIGGTSFDQLMIGVDRTRRVDDAALAAAAGVERTVARVPMIVVLDSDGVELGRVVETADRPLEQLLVEFLGPTEGW